MIFFFSVKYNQVSIEHIHKVLGENVKLTLLYNAYYKRSETIREKENKEKETKAERKRKRKRKRQRGRKEGRECILDTFPGIKY